MAQMRTAKLGKSHFERRKINRKKIVDITCHHREAICKLSSTLKEPQGSHVEAVKGQFALAVFISLCQKEVMFSLADNHFFISDTQKLNQQFSVFVFYWICFEKGHKMNLA